MRGATAVSGVIIWFSATGAASVLPIKASGSVSAPLGASDAATGSSTRSAADTTVPPGSWDLALTTVITAGPSGAAAEIPVSTAAMAASTASFLRCQDAARASA